MSLGDLRLGGSFSNGGLFFLTVHYEDRRLVASISFSFRALLITFFLFFPPRPENVAFIFQFNRPGIFGQSRIVTDGLGCHRLSPRKPRLRQPLAQSVLLPASTPCMPARLHFLQNAQLFDGTDGTLRSAGPRVRAGERKSCGHEQ